MTCAARMFHMERWEGCAFHVKLPGCLFRAVCERLAESGTGKNALREMTVGFEFPDRR
jgi:hypothetical protein